MGPVSIGLEVQGNTDGDNPSMHILSIKGVSNGKKLI